MKRLLFPLLFAVLLALGWTSMAGAQSDAGAQRVPAVPGEQIPLPNRETDAPDAEQWNRVDGQVWVRNVSRPSLYRVPPKNGRGNGQAVIVVPGGGFSFVSMDSEGFRVAERLAAQGYTAFVLKHRTVTSPEDPDEFIPFLIAEAEALGDDYDAEYQPAIADLAAALALVHEQAGAWGLNREDIGVIGFSAGALTAIRLFEQCDEARLIDHVALIYPPVPEVFKDGPRPALFLALAVDDFLWQRGHLDFVGAWMEQNRHVEFHLYSGGGHGFGMRPQGTTSDLWIDQYLAWLATR